MIIGTSGCLEVIVRSIIDNSEHIKAIARSIIGNLEQTGELTWPQLIADIASTHQ
jgi:hypothetical protein